jgi:pSer/pThr/pTyr-binding forkhead associated (FHA) protein
LTECVARQSAGFCVSGTDIFLSYARQDRTTARTVAESLVSEGFNVWWDASLHSGETFDEVIERNLRDAKAVVVLWSPRSVASRWVRAEATLADRRNKLVPAIIEACDRPIVFELTHTADLCDWHGDTSDVRWRQFVKDLHRMIDTAATRDAPKPTEEPPHAIEPASPPVARQPLRPGNDDVIVANRSQEPPVRPAQVAELRPQQAGEEEASAEVHCLEMENAVGEEELFVIASTGVKIGRTPPADIVIPDKSMSREHCIIGLANDELLVTDLNSTNGTYIDGERIERATVLPVASVVRLGRIALKHTIRLRTEVEARGTLDDPGGGYRAPRVAASS